MTDDDYNKRLRSTERKLDMIEVQMASLVKWTEKKDARAEKLGFVVAGILLTAVGAWIIGGGLSGV